MKFSTTEVKPELIFSFSTTAHSERGVKRIEFDSVDCGFNNVQHPFIWLSTLY